ncbi:peptide ABC transporter substrate-binding protein, partial [Butyricicoccus sp. 1XD8-22]
SAMMTMEPYNPETLLNNSITPKNFVDIDGVDYTQLEPLAQFTNSESFNAELALEYKEKALADLEGKATFPIKVLMPY